MIAEILSLQGIAQLKETIFAVKKYYNKDLEITGILLNKYNPRLVLTKEVEELAGMIAEQLGTKILSSRIMEYAPRSKATAEYRSLINEVTGVPMKKSQKKDSKRPVRRPSKKQ